MINDAILKTTSVTTSSMTPFEPPPSKDKIPAVLRCLLAPPTGPLDIPLAEAAAVADDIVSVAVVGNEIATFLFYDWNKSC